MIENVSQGSSSTAAAPRYFNDCSAGALTPLDEVDDLHRCKDGFGLSAQEVFTDAATRYNANFEEVWFHPFLRLRIHPADVQAIRLKFEKSTVPALPAPIQATLRTMQSNAETLLEAGRALASVDELAALETLDQCLRTAPDTAEAYLVRAKIYRSMGNQAQATCDQVMGSVLANGTGVPQTMDWMDLSPRSSRSVTPVLASPSPSRSPSPSPSLSAVSAMSAEPASLRPRSPSPQARQRALQSALEHLAITLATDSDPFDASTNTVAAFFAYYDSLPDAVKSNIDKHLRIFGLPFGEQFRAVTLGVPNSQNRHVGINDFGAQLRVALGNLSAPLI